jgi:hypothetical protein
MAEKQPVDHGSNGSAEREQARHPPYFSPATERPVEETQPRPKRRLKVPTTVHRQPRANQPSLQNGSRPPPSHQSLLCCPPSSDSPAYW